MATYQIDQTALVEGVKRGDDQAKTELYELVHSILHGVATSKAGPDDALDKIHDAYVMVLSQINSGKLKNPECLKGYISIIGQRVILDHIGYLIKRRNQIVELDGQNPAGDTADTKSPLTKSIHLVAIDPLPDKVLEEKQRAQILEESLSVLSPAGREILIRFYVYEQSREQIMREMDLSETQYRLLKHRSKARVGVVGKRKVQIRIRRGLKLSPAA